MLTVDPGQTTLRDYRFRHHFRAPDGGPGEGSRRHGRAGRDLELPLPPGTLVFDESTADLVADLISREQRLTIARGGRGGLGNVHFATATHRTPRHAQKGEPGEERRIRLELRLIAEIGLVGLPNAGKSSLLRALTAAAPRVAAYPFTTLEPNLGVLDLEARMPGDTRRPTIADLPGLIEGASAGAGLGHAFLRHVERTRLIVHVVDLAADAPDRDFEVIRDEVAARDPRLLERVRLVAANKIDLPHAAERAAAFVAARRADGLEAVAISAAGGTGLDELVMAIARALPATDPSQPAALDAPVVVHRFDTADDSFAVSREDDGFRVRGRRVERLVAQTNFEVDESAERFQRDLTRLGIDRELCRAGIRPGDVVRIGSHELEWEGDPWR